MTPEKAALLETKIKKRLVDSRKHLDALVHNAGEIAADFDRAAFERAWNASASSDERTVAYAVEAACNDVINGIMGAGQDICRLNGWTNQPNTDLSKPEILRHLEANGVIDKSSRKGFGDVCDARDIIQHDYVGLTADRLHETVTKVIRLAPKLLDQLSAPFVS